MGLGGDETSADTLWDIGGREAIAEHLREVADAKLDAREAEVGEADWAQVERIVLVRTIDSLWVEHLTELDDMRRGIGLRGYAQQDPLNEFRREAFRMYEEFRDLIRHGVASSIFRVTVQRQPPAGGDAALAQNLTRGVAAMRGSGNGAGAGAGDGRGGRSAGGGAGRGLGGAAWRGPGRAGGAQHHGIPRRRTRHGRSGAPGATARRRRGRRRSGRHPSPATRRPARGSAATTRAGAGPAPSTRSATAAERRRIDTGSCSHRRDRGRRLDRRGGLRRVPHLGPGRPR